MFTTFNNNIFNNKSDEIEIPESTDVVFISDMFIQNHVGGAELSSEALITSSPLEVYKVLSSDVTMELLSENVDKFWIFGNFSHLDANLIPSIVANMKYSIIEYDYKYCRYRSPEKHYSSEGIMCDCHNGNQGKLISAFYYGARSLWWMAEKQKEKYHTYFPFLGEKTSTVLSSIFDEDFFRKVNSLNEKYKDKKDEKYIIVGSTSWIKGIQDSEAYCKKNNLDYEIVWKLHYDELLEKLAQSKGMVFLPKGGDTCPRIVIEAKLLGCELHLNENVQHKDELWFSSEDILDTESYLYAARNRFWSAIKYDMNYNPTISGYTTTRNCISQGYPYIESIKSLLGFCNEVVIVDGGSDDGTWETILELSKSDDRIVAHQQIRDWNHKRHAVFDGAQKAVARSMCNSDFCWQQDVDEIVHEEDYDPILKLVKDLPKDINLVALPVVEYWGGPDKVRLDVNPWKWRLSRNFPHITHGIPASLRKYDESGELYSLPGTDGCDYIRSDNYETIKFATFYTRDVDTLRGQSFSSSAALESYSKWFNHIVENVPGVHHYSWYDLNRKIKTYRDYWSRHWQSLYDIKQEDTSENNMFFDKPWSKVTDKDIKKLSDKLRSKMGGWVFHQKIDFDQPTPHIEIERGHPELMNDWIKDK